jgi:hypothetical protein
MEFRIADLLLLIAELRESAVNNRKSSFKDDRNRDWLSTGNVEELKNAPQFQTHPIVAQKGEYSWCSLYAFKSGMDAQDREIHTKDPNRSEIVAICEEF